MPRARSSRKCRRGGEAERTDPGAQSKSNFQLTCGRRNQSCPCPVDLQAVLLLAFLTLLASSARAQTPQSGPGSLEKEVMEMRTENGAIREQLRKA